MRARPDQSSPIATCVALAGAGLGRHSSDRIVTIAARDGRLDARALVVDDDAALRMLCRVNLELEGFAVREAATVAEADAAVAAERPDVVLLDVHLGGEQTHAASRRSCGGDGIPVALVTGSVDIDGLPRPSRTRCSRSRSTRRTLVEIARRLARVAS